MVSLKEFFEEALATQRGQGFLWLPVCMAFGIMLYFSLPYEPSWIIGCIALFSAGCLLAGFRQFTILRAVSLYIVMFALGFAVSQARTSLVYTPILQKKMQPVGVEGTIDFIERLDAGAARRVILSDVVIERLEPDETPRKIRVNFKKGEGLAVGTRIKFLGGLIPPSAPLIPGGFDFQQHMFFKGIGASGFAFGAPEVLVQSGEGGFAERLRSVMEERIFGALEDSQGASVAAALMTGMRGSIAESDNEAMRGSGLAHMLAISGLHIGLFAGVVFFFLRLGLACFPQVALHYPIKKIAAIVAIVAAVFYMFMAGASVPTQRAVLMSAIVFIAIIADRSPLSMRLVAFAALCVLLIAPESLLGVSFQLSFAAVAALVAFYEWLAPWWRSMHKQAGFVRRAGLYLFGVCMTTMIATLATAPFALYHFQQLAIYSVLGNLLAMPVLTFIVMPFAVLSYLLMPLGLEGLSLPIVGWGSELILLIAHSVSSMDGAVMQVPMWSLPTLLSGASVFILAVLVKGRLKWFCLMPLILCALFIVRSSQPFFIVSNNAKLAAYYDGQDLSFNVLNKEYFTRDVWLRSYGLKDDAKKKWPREGRDGVIVCGEQGCRIEHQGYKLDFLYKAEAVKASCVDANMIFVQEPVKTECKNAKIIDLFDIFNGGAQGVYIGTDGLDLSRSEDGRGKRLWSADYQRLKRKVNRASHMP